MKFSIKDFFSTCVIGFIYMITFTKAILNGKLHSLCSVIDIFQIFGLNLKEIAKPEVSSKIFFRNTLRPRVH